MKGQRVYARGITGLLLVGVVTASIQPAFAVDINELRAQAQAIADEVSALERERRSLEADQSALDVKVSSVTAQIGMLEAESHDADAAVLEARDRYVERAVESYKSGSTTKLALLLSADSMGELLSLAEVTLEAGEIEGDALNTLLRTRSEVEKAQEELDNRKADLLAAQQRAQEVSAQMDDTLVERRATLREMTSRLQELEKRARESATISAETSGIDVGQELLDILRPAGPSIGIPDGFVSTGVTFEGVASWYGPGFEGNPTASGQIFDSSLFTAASKELPLGSWLHVAHQGKGVIVLVNDRGPYVGDRILDLSHAAAQAIGITGLGWVKATVVVKEK